jgi:hypothetical protein
MACGPTWARATSWPTRIRPTRSTPCWPRWARSRSCPCLGPRAGICPSTRCWPPAHGPSSSPTPTRPLALSCPPSRVRELATRFSGLLLVDEAYVDFADENSLGLVREFLQPDDLPHLEQGLWSGRPALRLRHRGTRSRVGDEQGQGQLQLRRGRHQRRRGGARRSGLRAPHLGASARRARPL